MRSGLESTYTIPVGIGGVCSILLICLSNKQSCDAGVDVADEDAAGHGAQAEAGEILPATGCEGADAANLDGAAGEVGKAAQRVDGDLKAAIMKRVGVGRGVLR